MYPPSREESLAETLATEQALSEITEIALDVWLSLARQDVLRAAAPAPPPNPANAADHEAQWNYLVDGLIVYAVSIIAADAFDKAYTVFTGAQLATAGAFTKLAGVDMPGMPTQIAMRADVGRILKRRLDITVASVEERIATVPDIRRFVSGYSAQIRGRVLDAVNRVRSRTHSILGKEPQDVTVAEQRADLAPVFTETDPEWQRAADMVGRDQATGALNAAVEDAARLSGRPMEIEWVAVMDSHTREAHRIADGQRRAPGQTFHVGGEELRFPRDPLGDPDNTFGCRCRLFAYFTGEARQDIQAAARPEPPDPAFVAEVEEYAKNWVDACGGLPKFIKRIEKHLVDGGMTKSHAIATAVNAARKMCDTGDVNFPGKQNVNPGSRAEACSAIAEWEKLKECAARKRAAQNSVQGECVECECDREDDSMTAGGPAVADYRSFTSVLAVIGKPTDDGRMFSKNIDLGFRDFPLPLRWQEQSTDGHNNSYTVGVIESAGIVGDEIIGKGYLLNTPQADQAAMQIEHGITEPSVDLGDVDWAMTDVNGQQITEDDFMTNPDLKAYQTVTSAKVLAATLVSTPAFGQTTITLGDMVSRGDAALVAAAMAHPGVIDLPTYDADLFANPQFSGPTLPHMRADGRIVGHLAAFGVCHIGIQRECVMAPRSQTDYAWFHTSPAVKTTSGPVKVGRLTVGGGHAGPRLSPAATISHYDDAGTCFALVHVGEDDYGVWFSGVAAPGATPEQIAQGLAAPLSGDWRNVGGNLELVAALSVNTPGFPILASGASDITDAPVSLVASLGPCAETADGPQFNREQIDVIVRLAAADVVREYRAAEARDKMAADIVQQELRRQALSIIEEA